MKRIVVFFLLLLYMGTSNGATVHFHYCMGRLVKWGLSQPEKVNCDFCKTPKKVCGKSCCKDDYKQAKIDKVQKTSAIVYQFKQAQVAGLNKISLGFVYVAIPIEIGKAALSNAPPPAEDLDVFMRNCTYRI